MRRYDRSRNAYVHANLKQLYVYIVKVDNNFVLYTKILRILCADNGRPMYITKTVNPTDRKCRVT